MIETRRLYRAQQISTGLEVMIWGLGSEAALVCDIEGLVVLVPWRDLKLNWRWNPRKGWIDLDLDEPVAIEAEEPELEDEP